MNSRTHTYIVGESVISSLGIGYEDHVDALMQNRSGIKPKDYPALGINDLPVGAISDELIQKCSSKVAQCELYTRFEILLIASVKEALKETGVDASDSNTLLIISTTKGNIDKIGDPGAENQLHLPYTANKVASFFSMKNKPMVISNACISGVLAMVYAQRLLQQGKYKHVIVAGADILSDFVVSGFYSFKSLSPTICKPFDKTRDGLNIGEAAACVVLSIEKEGPYCIRGGASANDANHISGPSRTGEGLYQAITHAASDQELSAVDYVSAHGTATPYNDDMESVAMARAGISSFPVNSYKGYIGHTLGAAGIAESVFSLWSIRNSILFKTYGFQEHGTVEPLHVINKNIKQHVNKVLKLASGFGGCNAAMILEKND